MASLLGRVIGATMLVMGIAAPVVIVVAIVLGGSPNQQPPDRPFQQPGMTEWFRNSVYTSQPWYDHVGGGFWVDGIVFVVVTNHPRNADELPDVCGAVNRYATATRLASPSGNRPIVAIHDQQGKLLMTC